MNLSFKANFQMGDIAKIIQDDTQEWLDELMETFREQGREFVRKARAKSKPEVDAYNNITWNLRSSIGYCLVYQGRVLESYFPSIKAGTVGEKTGEDVAERLALYGDYGNGVVLVMVAGMDYAAFVKAKGYDVIQSSSSTFETQIKQLLAA